MRVREVGTGPSRPGAYARAVADAAFRERYLDAYRGEAAPLDALWWLEHPEEPAPTGTESPWAAARRQRRGVYAPGATAAELEAAGAAERRAVGIRDAASAALQRALDAERAVPPDGAAAPRRPPRHGPRLRLLPLLAAVATPAVLAAALASLPQHHVDRPALARSLQRIFPDAAPRPADVRLALSGDGSETVARSVSGSASLRVTTVLCRGAGRIAVRLSDREDDGATMRCVAGRARLTRMLDTMPARPFLATVVVAGRVAWSVTVSNEDARYDARPAPDCVSAECW